MNDRLAFLRAIRANPDDDVARLVFADWLDERDDPLGELIRVQIELEPIRNRIDNPRAVELHKREDELLRAHGDDWIPTNNLLTNPADFGPVFRRGLPDYACLSLDTFLRNGEAIFAAYPTLREVALYGVANRCWELTLSPLLAKLDTLEIADWPTEDDAISLSVSPYIQNISRFKLWLGGESYMLNELVKQANANWPREIDLVQLDGGVSCDQRLASELDTERNRLVEEVNQKLGRCAIHITRPFERLFPLDGDLGYNLCAGHLPDGRPALAAGSFDFWLLVIFKLDGSVEESSVRESPVQSSRTYFHLENAFTDWVNEELELKPGLIWVQEFQVEHLRVWLWDWDLQGRLDIYDRDPDNQIPWRDRGGEARGWLERKEFIIGWFDTYWADWRGKKIHSS